MSLIARIIPLFACLFLLACSNTEEIPVPEDVLHPEQMILVMTDMHLIEGAKIGRKIMGDSILLDEYYHKIFDKYQIDKDIFERSFRFYSAEPPVMDKIYERVLENLNELQGNAPLWEENQIIEEEVLERADSIRSEMKSDSTRIDSINGSKLPQDSVPVDQGG